jgi:hypothetical protein
VFAKVDLTFGDEVDGLGGKACMRVACAAWSAAGT